jgi:hypothetical protein
MRVPYSDQKLIQQLFLDLFRNEGEEISIRELKKAKPKRFDFLRDRIVKDFDSAEYQQDNSKRYGINKDRSERILEFLRKGKIQINQKVREHLCGIWLIQRDEISGSDFIKRNYFKEGRYQIDGNKKYCWQEFKKLKLEKLNSNPKESRGLKQSKEVNEYVKPPDFLVGIYEAYFVRPRQKSLAIGYVFLKPNGALSAKTTATGTQCYKGDFHYEEELDSLTCNFTYEKRRAAPLQKTEVNNKKVIHKFIIELFVPKDPQQRKYLGGIYGGNNPEFSRPVAGRMMFKKIARCDKSSAATCESFFAKINPIDVNDAQNIANLLLTDYYDKQSDMPIKLDKYSRTDFALLQNRKLQIEKFLRRNKKCQLEGDLKDDPEKLIHFFNSNEYVENLKFIEGVTKETDDKMKILSGDYSVFTLHSSKIMVVVSSARLDRLGNIYITGRGGNLYSGKATIFKNLYLNIAIEERNDQKLFINYIIKIGEAENHLGRYHGIRIIRAQNEKPNASRVIFKIEKYGYFKSNLKELVYEEVPLFPVSIRDEKPVYDSNAKQVETYRRNPEIMEFLTGDINNLLVGYESSNHELKHSTEYGQLFFELALKSFKKYENIGDGDEALKKNLLNECIRYLDRSSKNGFQGAKNIKTLSESDIYKNTFIKDDLILTDDFFFSKSRFHKAHR